MDIIIGLLVWGGLLLVASRVVVGLYRRPRSAAPAAPPRRGDVAPRAAPGPAGSPPTLPPIHPVFGETERESAALVDGLIIGHHLTRTHYEDRLEEQAETLDALRSETPAAWCPGDEGDIDEFDADEFGTEEFDADAFDADAFDEPGAAGDPWADDVFGFDEDDDDD